MKHEALSRCRELQRVLGRRRRLLAQPHRQIPAIGTDQAGDDRDKVRRLGLLAGRVRHRLCDVERVARSGRIVGFADLELRGASVVVPVLDLLQIPAGCIGHAAHEILGGHRLAVVPLEI